MVLRQTKATLAGYLALDASDPLPKVVLPDEAQVDAHLSRQLTHRVRQEGKTVWLGTDLAHTRPTDSLMPFSDAMCVPVRASGPPFGALHVYRAGAFFTERDVKFCEAVVGYLGNSLQTLRARRTLEFENSRLRSHMPVADELIGDSPALRDLRERLRRAAPQSATVLIEGESGVGKELVATALHRQSRRADGPMVPVNCAAIQQSMLEAELFGYRKGAFTGADRDYPGLFQMADEGTLFLDEVGELSGECQAKLLRVIEGKSFRPLGTTRSQDRRPRAGRHQPQPRQRGQRRAIPPGSLLQTQRHYHPRAAVAGAHGGHPGPGRILSAKAVGRVPPDADGHRRRPGQAAGL